MVLEYDHVFIWTRTNAGRGFESTSRTPVLRAVPSLSRVARENPQHPMTREERTSEGLSRATLNNDGTARSAVVREELSKLRPAFVRGQINT